MDPEAKIIRPPLHRSASTYYSTNYQYTFIQNKENDGGKMHGSRRVIIFCLLTTVLPSILIVLPLYLRHIKYADVLYKISDSDVIQIHKGQSSIFCEKHSLKMNSTFNAFQMRGRPELSNNKKKHITLSKTMTLPDDTLEYWGFYLFKSATVKLEVCSRYEGSKILVVKGEKILDTCGILDVSNRKTPSVIENPNLISTVHNPNEKKEKKSLVSKKLHRNNDIHSNEIENYNVDSIISIKNNYTEDIKLNEISSVGQARKKRDVKRSTVHPNTILDTGVYHGGNAFNSTDNTPQDSGVSSFENNLHECYHDNILMNKDIPGSNQCISTSLENTTTLKVTHDVLNDGYYYYIFYSDNDIVNNTIHAIFDIDKPTFQYVNMSDSKRCVNKTECVFDVGFFSDELVIVEVPTEDGFRNDDDESNQILVSICHPRMSVYIFFPIAVLLIILIFAFL